MNIRHLNIRLQLSVFILVLLPTQAASAPVILSMTQTIVVQDGAQDGKSQSGELEEANRLNASVMQLYRASRFKEALPLANRALELTEKALGAEHQDVAPVLANLAELYIALKQYRQAEPLYQRSLTILVKALGPDHENLRNYLYRLALLHYLRNDYRETEALYQRAISISEKAFGAEHMEAGKYLEKLALFYDARGEFGKANEAYSRLIEMVEKAPESVLSGTAESLTHYGCLRSKLKEATNLYEGPPFSDKPLNSKAVVLIKPIYPVEARMSRAQGHVLVRVLVNEEGKVSQACVMIGPKALAKAAEDAAMSSRFPPTLVRAKPVKVKGFITYTFVSQ